MWLKSKPKGDDYQVAVAKLFGVDSRKPALGCMSYDRDYKHLSKIDITKFKAADFL